MFIFSVLILLAVSAMIVLFWRRHANIPDNFITNRQNEGGYIKIYGGEEVYEESYLIFKKVSDGQIEVNLQTNARNQPYFYQNNKPVANFKKQISISNFNNLVSQLIKFISLDDAVIKTENLNQYTINIHLSSPAGRLDKELDENNFTRADELLDYLDKFVKNIK